MVTKYASADFGLRVQAVVFIVANRQNDTSLAENAGKLTIHLHDFLVTFPYSSSATVMLRWRHHTTVKRSPGGPFMSLNLGMEIKKMIIRT